MTTTVQVPVSLGGTNTAYNDGTGAYGMASNNGYGYTTYLMPMLSEVLAACAAAVAAAGEAVDHTTLLNIGTNTHAQIDTALTRLADTSGTNTGDQTSVSGNAGTATALATARNIDGQAFDGTANITVIAPGTAAAASKATPVDADVIPLVDSAASNVLKKLTWANVKATLKTYLDTLYQTILVSGTSIKTVNGNTLLGAGDISVAPAGAGTELQYRNGTAFGAMSGTAWDDTNRAETRTGATVTASNPVQSFTQTWNNVAVTFTGRKMNITDTASAAASLFEDWQVAGVSKARILKDGSGVFGKFTLDQTYGLQVPSGSGGLSVGTTSALSYTTLGIFVNKIYFDLANQDTVLSRVSAGVLEVNNGTNGTTRDFRLRHQILTGLPATAQAASTLASAGTIAPTLPIHFVSGTAAIATITAPAPISAGGGQITLIPTGIFTTTTAGNIALASTAVVSKALTMTYDTTTAKWYPSY